MKADISLSKLLRRIIYFLGALVVCLIFYFAYTTHYAFQDRETKGHIDSNGQSVTDTAYVIHK